MDELNKVLDEFRTLVGDLRGRVDRAEAETKGAREKFDTLDVKAIEKVNARLDEVETVLRRPIVVSSDQVKSLSPERQAFKSLIRGGLHTVKDEHKQFVKFAGPDDAKALSLADDTGGGFLAPSEFVTDIIKGVVLISPIRGLANVRQTDRRSVIIPVRTGLFAAQWISEIKLRTETTGLAYGRQEIPAHEMYAEVIVSQQDLEDSAFDLDTEIVNNASEQFAVLEGKAFVNGDGNGKPFGLTTNQLVAQDTTAVATKVDFTDLITTMYNLKSFYATNASWLMARQTIGFIRQLKDSQNRYIWEPSYPNGMSGMQPATILGRPYTEVPDLALPATATTFTSGSLPILFGDFKRAYTLVDRVQIVVKRLVEKYAETGQIAILVRKRVGGQVVLPEAMRIIKIA